MVEVASVNGQKLPQIAPNHPLTLKNWFLNVHGTPQGCKTVVSKTCPGDIWLSRDRSREVS